MTEPVTVLAVDDLPQNLRLLQAVLEPRGYHVVLASSGEEALETLSSCAVDLVLLDIVMPGMDGYEVCRRVRADDATAYLPVVMITASGDQEKVRALRAGADDFITKPLHQGELVARVASLARVKRYQDTIARQAAELVTWSRELEQRVQTQVEELQRLQRLRRFLSPQLADIVIDSADESLLEAHRREVVVVFCDLRGFTPFAEASEPEEVMEVLGEYHHALGELIFEFEGTLERFTGDGLMVFFNDPFPCDDPPARAVSMAVAMQRTVGQLAAGWARRGHELGLGVGIAQGYATLGRIGFEGRFDYAAIGNVTNLAARLCGAAATGQTLVSRRVFSAVEDRVQAEAVRELNLRGFSRPISAYGIRAIDGRLP
jgi:adenylate cyclase